MNIRSNSAFLLVITAMLSACASTHLSREQLNNQYPTMAQLEKGLDDGKNNGIQLLSPELFQRALNKYLEAHLAANNGQADIVNKETELGLTLLGKARAAAESSREVLSEVLDARGRAKKAGADKFYANEMQDQDQKLVKISRLIERNDIEKAKNHRRELQHAYTDLELRALQKSTLLQARKSIKYAIENDADKLAPKTLSKAEEELVRAKSVLEVDRTNRDKANKHAWQATVLANRSNFIATMIKEFDRQDFSQEDIVLSFQNNIGRIGKAISKEPQFDRPIEITVTNLEKDIKNVATVSAKQEARIQQLESKMIDLLASNEKNLTQLRTRHAEEIANLQARYSGEISVLGKTQQQLERLQEEQQARFERIQNMFSDKEANVFRKKNNVLISVHGFKFPSGSAEIRPGNFGLMKKIVKAINEFKGSKIIVSGHTDGLGPAAINKKLSQSRADSVSRFFVDVAGLKPIRIQTKGFGQEKPVASNKSAEGRAQNRRVEILIVNE